MSKNATLSFRVSPEIAQQTDFYARLIGVSKTRYIEQAIQEKNKQIMAEKLQQLSLQISSQSLQENQAMSAANGDGLA